MLAGEDFKAKEASLSLLYLICAGKSHNQMLEHSSNASGGPAGAHRLPVLIIGLLHPASSDCSAVSLLWFFLCVLYYIFSYFSYHLAAFVSVSFLPPEVKHA